MAENRNHYYGSAANPRLRSSEPDLKIIVGNDREEATEEFMHYSVVLAFESGYIDTILSTRVGAQDGTITFPDVTPVEWRLMMKFLRDPNSIKKYRVEDLFHIVELYDKYQFTMGLKICDDYLLDALPYHGKECEEDIKDFDYIDIWIDIILLSQQANLTKSFKAGKGWLSSVFYDALQPHSLKFATDLFLTETQIKKLAPVLKVIEADIIEYLDNPDTTIDVSNDLFPRYVHQEAAAIGRKARQKYPKVEVSFIIDTELAGIYKHVRSSDEKTIRYQLFKNGRWQRFELRRCPEFGYWELCEIGTVCRRSLFRCKTGHYRFLQVPPPFHSKWMDLQYDEVHGDLPHFPTIHHNV